MIARIRFDGGMLMLPAHTPYDCEELAATLDWYAGQYARVRLELDGGDWLVTRAPVRAKPACSGCSGAGAALIFGPGARTALCAACVRRVVGERGGGPLLAGVTPRRRHDPLPSGRPSRTSPGQLRHS